MTPNDMVYDAVYKQCLKAKCDEFTAKNAAVMTLQKFKNNQFITPAKLIKQAVSDAKKLMMKKKAK